MAQSAMEMPLPPGFEELSREEQLAYIERLQEIVNPANTVEQDALREERQIALAQQRMQRYDASSTSRGRRREESSRWLHEQIERHHEP